MRISSLEVKQQQSRKLFVASSRSKNGISLNEVHAGRGCFQFIFNAENVLPNPSTLSFILGGHIPRTNLYYSRDSHCIKFRCIPFAKVDVQQKGLSERHTQRSFTSSWFLVNRCYCSEFYFATTKVESEEVFTNREVHSNISKSFEQSSAETLASKVGLGWLTVQWPIQRSRCIQFSPSSKVQVHGARGFFDASQRAYGTAKISVFPPSNVQNKRCSG